MSSHYDFPTKHIDPNIETSNIFFTVFLISLYFYTFNLNYQKYLYHIIT